MESCLYRRVNTSTNAPSRNGVFNGFCVDYILVIKACIRYIYEILLKKYNGKIQCLRTKVMSKFIIYYTI